MRFDSFCRDSWKWLKTAWFKIRYRKLRRKFISTVNYVPTNMGRKLIQVQIVDNINDANKPVTLPSRDEIEWQIRFKEQLIRQNEELCRIREEFKQKKLDY